MINTTSRIGSSCPWRVVAPADLTPIARDLEAARTRPQVRAMLAAEAASAVSEPAICGSSTDAPVTFAGVTLEAPGFTSEQFQRAVLRALIDELQLTEAGAGRWIVSHRDVNGGYLVTVDRCDCKAGQAGTPCKHRAAVILHEQVRIPAQRKQWAQLQRRQGGKVVA